MVKLKDIFNLWYGVNLEVVNSTVVEKGIPFISRQSVNNGVVCYVAPIEGVKPNPAKTLSIAVSGSVLSTFYHDYEYYSGRDVYVAEPKEPMTKEEMLYYAYIIELNRYRYNYGRGANRTFKDILVPNRNEIPAYIKEIIAPSIKNEIINKNHIKINTENWAWFYIKNIFKLEPSKGIITEDLVEGRDIPYIAAKYANNGCEMMCSREGNEQYISKGNCIVFICLGAGSAGYALYQGGDFIGMSGKTICGYNTHLNQYNGLFIATILCKERPKYSFGRSWTGNRLKNTRIKLPITASGEPDWQFMEDYIKSLPYSKNLEPVDPNEQIRALKKKLALKEHQLKAQQNPSNLVNYGTVNIYER